MRNRLRIAGKIEQKWQADAGVDSADPIGTCKILFAKRARQQHLPVFLLPKLRLIHQFLIWKKTRHFRIIHYDTIKTIQNLRQQRNNQFSALNQIFFHDFIKAKLRQRLFVLLYHNSLATTENIKRFGPKRGHQSLTK